MVATEFPTREDQMVCCTDKWAVRHYIVHEATGLVIPMVCDKYSCMYCGPRRVELWRSLIETAEPERFITLTRVGRTLFEVGRVATTVVQRLRRKGYAFEYCMTFEQHTNGYFHIHMLQKGDYIPQRFLSDCLRSATHGFSSVVDIRRCRAGTAGYVTKYCTKMLAQSDIGTKPDGTRARINRVRYSKGFFPSTTQEMKIAFRAASAEKRGGDAISYEGAWRLQEFAPLPCDDQGHVVEELARMQYRQLIADRKEGAKGEPLKLSKGGRQVLSFMMFESLGVI